MRVARFQTVSAIETPAAMKELHEQFAAASESGEHHPLLLVGCYVFDFLAIHPFRDGNGRISRLLTLLALYQAGYKIGRYVSDAEQRRLRPPPSTVEWSVEMQPTATSGSPAKLGA